MPNTLYRQFSKNSKQNSEELNEADMEKIKSLYENQRQIYEKSNEATNEESTGENEDEEQP